MRCRRPRNPAPGEALFFVAVGDGSGRHLFARTLAEHQANVRSYLQQLSRSAQRLHSAMHRSDRGDAMTLRTHPRFVTLEGGEGAGKSTVLSALREVLHDTRHRSRVARANPAARRWPSRSAACCSTRITSRRPSKPSCC